MIQWMLIFLLLGSAVKPLFHHLLTINTAIFLGVKYFHYWNYFHNMFLPALDIYKWFYTRNKLHWIAFCFWYYLDISVSWLSLKQTFSFIPVHHLCTTRTMPQLKQFHASFSSWSSRFNPRLSHARFTMVEVALDQILLQVSSGFAINYSTTDPYSSITAPWSVQQPHPCSTLSYLQHSIQVWLISNKAVG